LSTSGIWGNRRGFKQNADPTKRLLGMEEKFLKVLSPWGILFKEEKGDYHG